MLRSSFSIIRCFEFSYRTSVFSFIATDMSGGIPSNCETKGEFLLSSLRLFDLHMRTLSRHVHTNFKLYRCFIQ